MRPRFFYNISCQQEIKRLRSRHLISPAMITKKSLSAECVRRVAAAILECIVQERIF